MDRPQRFLGLDYVLVRNYDNDRLIGYNSYYPDDIDVLPAPGGVGAGTSTAVTDVALDINPSSYDVNINNNGGDASNIAENQSNVVRRFL